MQSRLVHRADAIDNLSAKGSLCIVPGTRIYRGSVSCQEYDRFRIPARHRPHGAGAGAGAGDGAGADAGAGSPVFVGVEVVLTPTFFFFFFFLIGASVTDGSKDTCFTGVFLTVAGVSPSS